MSTSWHSICHPGLPICIQRPRIGAGTQSANAVRKEWRDEKAICNDVEYRDDDFPVGHGWNGADVLPGRGGVSEGHADADRQEPGCSGASLAGWCSVAGHPVAAEPGHPVAAEPGHPVAAEPGHPVAAEPGHPVAAEPGHPVAAEPGHPVAAEPG